MNSTNFLRMTRKVTPFIMWSAIIVIAYSWSSNTMGANAINLVLFALLMGIALFVQQATDNACHEEIKTRAWSAVSEYFPVDSSVYPETRKDKKTKEIKATGYYDYIHNDIYVDDQTSEQFIESDNGDLIPLETTMVLDSEDRPIKSRHIVANRNADKRAAQRNKIIDDYSQDQIDDMLGAVSAKQPKIPALLAAITTKRSGLQMSINDNVVGESAIVWKNSSNDYIAALTVKGEVKIPIKESDTLTWDTRSIDLAIKSLSKK